jgi:predicted small lipoprotein YifL
MTVRQRLSALVLLAALFTLTACALPAMPSAAPVDAGKQDRLDEASRRNALWRDMRVEVYTIDYLLVEGPDGTPPAYRRVSARGNFVLDTTCPESKCPTSTLRDVRLIHELFAMVNADATGCAIKVLYHPDFHFPSLIQRNCSASGGSVNSLVVVGFAPRH